MAKFNPDNYVNVLAKDTPRRFAFKAKTVAELKKWQEVFRPCLREKLGLDEIAKRGQGPLEPRQLSEQSFDTYVRQEWVIQSEPGLEIPFYLLLPKKQTKRLPVVLTPHGHGKEGKDNYVGIGHTEETKKQISEGQRDIALQAVQAGYIAIAPDMRGFAGLRRKIDREEDNNSSCRTMQMHALLFGRTILGERVWDIQRLVDYALTRDDIDSNRIGITGNSGGGTVSLFAAACDERIKLAMPSCYFNTFEDSIGTIKHCECNYIPGMMTLGEMYEVAGLIAPRPFLAIAGKDDEIFPVEAAQDAYKKLRKIYEVAGAGDRCQLFIGDGGHRYYKDPVWKFVKEIFGQ